MCLVAGLLLHQFLRLSLLGLEEGAEIVEDVGTQHQGAGDDSLAAGNVAITAALLVLVAVCAEHPVLCLGGLDQRPAGEF